MRQDNGGREPLSTRLDRAIQDMNFSPAFGRTILAVFFVYGISLSAICLYGGGYLR